jgi:hypothetical protein
MYGTTLVGIILFFIGTALLRRTARALGRPSNQLRLQHEREFLASFAIVSIVELFCCVSGLVLIWRDSRVLAGLLVLLCLSFFIWARRRTSDEGVIALVFEEYRNRRAKTNGLDDVAILRATAQSVFGKLGWEEDEINDVLKLIFNDEQLPYLHGVRNAKELAGAILWQYDPSEDQKKNETRFSTIDRMWGSKISKTSPLGWGNRG